MVPDNRHSADWRSLLAAGRQAMGQGRTQAALDALRRARDAAPEQREVRYWLGNALRLAGKPREAEAEFRELLREQPGDAEPAFALAWLLREQGRAGDSAEVLVTAARRQGSDAGRLLQITGFLRDSNRFEEAIETLQMAISLRPDDPGLQFRLARLYQATGRFAESLERLRAALERDPSTGGAWLSLAQLQRFDHRDNEDFRRLLAAAERPAGPEAELCIAFALGKACDDLGDRASAWHHYTRGNLLRSAMQPWDRVASQRQVGELLSAKLPPALPAAAPARHPVYVVGMLRSGTTLVEQLLDRHPRIHGRGELNFLAQQAAVTATGTAAVRQAAADTLWTHLRLDGPEGAWYVDKNPLNFRFLGSLASLLPEARIIHVARDGRDACLSCYFQLFQHPDAGFANALDDLVDYYRGYRRLMRRWRAELADRLLTVRYEDLVQNCRPTLERLLDHLGLDWDDRLVSADGSDRPIRTASTWQARQPLHRASIGRWRNYREFAPDFFAAVRDADRE